MATMKEYGLIFEDMSVKIVEAVVDKSKFSSFTNVKIVEDLEKELHRFLNFNNYHPKEIIPDTAFYSGNFKKTKIREATAIEQKEYLVAYEENRNSLQKNVYVL